jgi:hypothetical protein
MAVTFIGNKKLNKIDKGRKERRKRSKMEVLVDLHHFLVYEVRLPSYHLK